MPAVLLLVPVSDQNPRRLASSQDGNDFIGLGTLEIGVHEVVTATLGHLQNRRVPLLGTVGHPVLVLVGNCVEKLACDTLSLPVGVEEADHSFGLLKRLDQSIQEQPIETTIGEANAMLVMLEEGVHENLQRGEIPGSLQHQRLLRPDTNARSNGISRAKPLPS